jgi:hypothetical protein
MAMGYQGFVDFSTDGSEVVLATAASINMMLEPLTSEASWGAGWYNASTAHYADMAIRYEGSIEIEFQMRLWSIIRDWVIEDRVNPISARISPDGTKIYTYTKNVSASPPTGLFNTSCSFNTSEGSFLNCSLGALALDRTTGAGAGYLANQFGEIGNSCEDFGATNPLNPSGTNIDPIPFWKTTAGLYVVTSGWKPGDAGTEFQEGAEAVDWEVSVNQSQIMVNTCNGKRTLSAVLMGRMEATGNLTLFHINGVTDPVLYAETTMFEAEIGHGTAKKKMYLTAVTLEGDDYSLQGPDAVINRSFSMRGLGGRCDSNAIPPFYMVAMGA